MLNFQPIQNLATRLDYATILPAKEAVMLLDGQKYLTGSDYSNEVLNKIINECFWCGEVVQKYFASKCAHEICEYQNTKEKYL